MKSVMTEDERKLEKMLAEFQERIAKDVTAFQEESKTTKAERLAACEHDNGNFGRTYLPHYFTSPDSPFHADLDKMSEVRKRHIFVIHGPREHAKSVRFRAALLRKILYGEFHYPLFISEDLKDAKKHLFELCAEMTSNPRITGDFKINITTLNLTEGIVRGTVTRPGKGLSSHFSLEAASYGTKVKGSLFMQWRPDAAFIDDFENTRTSRNPETGKAKLNWVLQELYGAVAKNAPIFWVGNTGAATSALYYAFLKAFDDDEVALREWLKRGTTPGDFGKEPAPFTGDFSVYCYRAERPGKDGKTEYLWPQNHSIEWYVNTKLTVGPFIYESEYNGNPVREGEFFKSQWLPRFEIMQTPEGTIEMINAEGESRLLKLNSKDLRWYSWLDPAFGTSTSSCFKSIVVLAGNGFDYCLIDAYCRNDETLASALDYWYTLFERYKRYGLRNGGYENNFGQDDRVIRDLNDLQWRHGYALPVSGDANQGNKNARIESLEPVLSQGRFWFPKDPNRDVQEIINQLLSYPFGPIDGPDALESCFSRMRFTPSRGGDIYKTVRKRRTTR